MLDSATTQPDFAGIPRPDLSGSHPHSARQLPQDSHAQQFWSPLCFSSPSASTEYWSTNASPANVFNPLDGVRDSDPPKEILATRPQLFFQPQWSFPHSDAFSGWRERVIWSAPSPLEGCYIPPWSESTFDDVTINEDVCSESILETPKELVYSLTQDEVDKNMAEMTCGPKLEEHFWPIRYKIRSGKLTICENTINVLIVQARSEEPRQMHSQLSKLTGELASHRETSSSLTRFLDESRNMYKRLWQFNCRLPPHCEQQIFNGSKKPFGRTISS
ncbi:hypothetical protein DFH08DRAFT_401996 [Mycena albidolilacea]|uniref:Uncharacterized protein n=1 Tax=Mycena albidolilacea TaxID=1033008 RepID=A0AAD6ZDR6_9AGAR|nr:hypothetical protein DFH08DRAFT_401996 [Mycena albidolilacea]